MLLKKTKINQNTSSLGPKNTIFLSQQQLYQTELSWALPTRTELSRSCPNNNNNSNDNNNNGNNNNNNNNNNNSNNLIKSLSFYILHLNNLIPDLFETWNLKFNSTLLSWCVFNSDDIIEAPDQTDCITTWRQRAFESSLILSTKKLQKQWNRTLGGFQIQNFFSKNNLCITFMMCF